MPRFHYNALNLRGDEQAGELDAPDREQAVAALKAQELFPLRLVPAVKPAAAVGSLRASAAGWRWAVPLFAPVKARELAVFTRQLAALLHAGMPLLRGLETLARQERNRALQMIVTTLADDIRSGSALSEALARHPRLFGRLYLNMVRAGEAGGALDAVLDRLARYQEKMLRLRGRVKAAMVYPLIVMTLAGAILAGLLVFVVPRFKQIFADLLKGAPLPPLTQAVLTVSETVKGHYPAVLAAGVAAGLGFRFFRRTPLGGRLVDGLLVRLPLFGELLLKSLVAQFSRTLGTLLASGVPILQALAIARDTCGNQRVAAAIERVHTRVKEGDPVAAPLAQTGVFPGMVTIMIEVGEHTGQLPEMLGRVADIFEEEVDNAVAGLSSLIEPLLIVALAGVVGTIVIALFLPIIRVVQLLT
jgi:type IV pilus assembly protein PilC